MRKRVATLALLAALAAAVAGPGAALADGPVRITVSSVDPFDYPDVRFTASLSDDRGRALKGAAGDLYVYEGGVLQTATIDAAAQLAPLALVLVLDTSGGMSGRAIADAKRAIASLVGSLGPTDQVSLVTFNARARVVQPLTTDKAAVTAATNAAVAGGDAAINDAVLVGADVLGRAEPGSRRAMILLSSGYDIASRASPDGVLQRVAGDSFPINAIALGPDLDLPALSRLATTSAGGRVYQAPTSAELAGIYAALGEQIRTAYSIRYRSGRKDVPGGATVNLELRVQQGAAVLSTTTVTFQVPVGRGAIAAAASAKPAQAVLPREPALQGQRAPVRTSPELVAILGIASVLAFLLWVGELGLQHPNRQRRRLELFVQGLSLTAPEHAKRRSLIQRLVVPAFRSVGGPFLRITPTGFITSMRQRLLHAGGPAGLGPAEFFGVRVGAAMLGGIAGFALATATATDLPSTFSVIGVATVVGYVIPGLLLDLLARRRQSAIRRALPSALDMLSLSVEAGLSLDGAIAQVAQRWKTPLSEELRRVLLEFQMGRARGDALRSMADRTGVSELSRLVNAIIQGDALGAPVARVLRPQADRIRVERRQHAEEMARKAPVKMLFPMVLLIFPALFVVVLGPAIPRMLDIFTIVR